MRINKKDWPNEPKGLRASVGSIELNESYWDCECKEDFIHSKIHSQECSKCGARQEDQPDSRAIEVKVKNLKARIANLKEMLRHEEELTARLQKWLGESEWTDFVDANHKFIFED